MTEPDLRARHLADQHDAARADARDQALAYVADLLPGQSASVAVEKPAPWLLDWVDRHNQLVAAGECYSCPHHNRATDVEAVVIHLALWMPGRVACTSCARAGIFTARPPYLCGPCGADTGPEPGHGAFQLGNLIFHFRLCRQCL